MSTASDDKRRNLLFEGVVSELEVVNASGTTEGSSKSLSEYQPIVVYLE